MVYLELYWAQEHRYQYKRVGIVSFANVEARDLWLRQVGMTKTGCIPVEWSTKKCYIDIVTISGMTPIGGGNLYAKEFQVIDPNTVVINKNSPSSPAEEKKAAS